MQQILLNTKAPGRERTQVRLGPELAVGGDAFVVIAGPCAVEDARQIARAADIVAAAGCSAMRGGAHKPRTSPYTFQGLGNEGVKLLASSAKKHGLAAVSEVMDPADLEHFDDIALLQVGARNMQNFTLLKALAKSKKPVLLKRGFAATIDEWLLAAEYLLEGGNEQVILCERGIRTFEPATRATLDLSAVIIARQRTHLPVVVDPSHAAGRRDLVIPLSLAAAACGADGLLVEMHPEPAKALCDGAQALEPNDLFELMRELPGVLAGVGRTLYKMPVEQMAAAQ